QTASELARVCRAGGKVGLANWTPDGFIGQLFKTLGRHIAPPAGVSSPAQWGRADWIEGVFGSSAASISIKPRNFIFRYRSPDHFVDFFRTFYGPVHKAFLALEPAQQAALEADLHTTVAAFNTATDGSMRVPSDYVEIVIVKA
ncbi:MAG: SAM-dependent methyltransferase, partial [Proteobacteria bacterium]|nr:SAM-dependent methyltransferase [Pseudomonadota bacterium]